MQQAKRAQSKEFNPTTVHTNLVAMDNMPGMFSPAYAASICADIVMLFLENICK